MSTSPFMDDYSSEDYSDHEDDYYFVPTATSPPQPVRAQVEIQTQSNELQNLIIDQQGDVSESVYFDVLPELEAETTEEELGGWMEQSIYLAVESYFDDLGAQAETGVAAAALKAETAVEELAVGSYFDDLGARAETGGGAAALEAETVVEEGHVIESESLLTVDVDTEVEIVEAQAETGVTAALEAETVVEELAVGSYFDLEAQVETGVAAALEAETTVEEADVIESESKVVTVEADTEVETVERMIEEFVNEAVESEFDLEAEDAIEEPNSNVEDETDAVAPEAETAVREEDVIEELLETVTADVTLNPDTAVEEGDVIGEAIYEVVESDYDLEAEIEAEDMVEEEDDVVEEEEDMVEEEEDFVEGEDGMVEEEEDFVDEEHEVMDEPMELDINLQAEAGALVEEGAAVEESIYEPLESNSDLQAEEPEALSERAVVSIEMTTFKVQEPDSDLEPEDLIDEQSDSAEEESDLSEEECDSEAEDSDQNEKEWDSDAEEIAMDPEDSDTDSSDSDLTEEEEDDVVVSYLNSSTPIRSQAWEFLVPASALAWAKLPVTDTTTLEDSSLRESFLGCSNMFMLQTRLQECGNAVMNFIGTLLCELSRIRNDLRRVLGALFRKRETTKHA